MTSKRSDGFRKSRGEAPEFSCPHKHHCHRLRGDTPDNRSNDFAGRQGCVPRYAVSHTGPAVSPAGVISGPRESAGGRALWVGRLPRPEPQWPG